jgi:uncharacterized protein (UPF0212 family)
MTEYAVLERGEIINVVTTDTIERARYVARAMVGHELAVVPLDSVPLDVKRRYRYWDERP